MKGKFHIAYFLLRLGMETKENNVFLAYGTDCMNTFRPFLFKLECRERYRVSLRFLQLFNVHSGVFRVHLYIC
jgi:hypothetical protein